MKFLFLLYPVAEILLWSSFLQLFGWGDAFMWCLTSAIVGMVIMRLQGTAAFLDLQVQARSGKMPGTKTLHHLLMSMGGLFLILPGLLTDVIGAILILPGTRHLMVWWIQTRGKMMMSGGFTGFAKSGRFGTFVFTQGMGTGTNRPTRDVSGTGNVIDVKATVVSDEQLPGPRKSDS